MRSWVHTSEEDAGVLARAIVRLAMSYVSMPPEADHDVAADLARLMTPFAERYGEVQRTGRGPAPSPEPAWSCDVAGRTRLQAIAG